MGDPILTLTHTHTHSLRGGSQPSVAGHGIVRYSEPHAVLFPPVHALVDTVDLRHVLLTVAFPQALSGCLLRGHGRPSAARNRMRRFLTPNSRTTKTRAALVHFSLAAFKFKDKRSTRRDGHPPGTTLRVKNKSDNFPVYKHTGTETAASYR